MFGLYLLIFRTNVAHRAILLLAAIVVMIGVKTKVYGQSGQLNGHEYVDLGLPSGTKWATCNVGANEPEEYGVYFAWGETFGDYSASGETVSTTHKRTYNWENYKYEDGGLKKYCSDSEYGRNGYADSLTVLEPSDDAATVIWGEDWRMPTKEDFEELISNCDTTWTAQNGINGMRFTAPNGNSIFLPATGYKINTIHYSGNDGYYWSSTLCADNPRNAWRILFSSSMISVQDYYRCYGRTVRPVVK